MSVLRRLACGDPRPGLWLPGRGSPPLCHHPDEEYPADKTRDHANGQILGGYGNPGQGVRPDQEDRAGKGRAGKDAGIVPPDHQSDKMWHHQAHKADQAGKGDHDPGDQRRHDKDDQTKAADLDPKARCRLVAEEAVRVMDDLGVFAR